MKKHIFTRYVDGKEVPALLIFYTNNKIQKLWMLFLFLIENANLYLPLCLIRNNVERNIRELINE